MSSKWREAAIACRWRAEQHLGAYPSTDYLKAAEYLKAADVFDREHKKLER